MSANQLEALKQAARATWGLGDYHAIAARELWPVGARVVERVGVGAGDAVLDVACGSGNAAIPAAQAGARVTAVDLVPELLDAGRRAAAQVGVDIDWLEGDAEALPAGDARFDVVVSTFGCMFAPRHQVAAREIDRVLRPGGRIGLCTWPQHGIMAEFFNAMDRYLPPMPAFAAPPVRWGDEEYVRGLFAHTAIELAFEREAISFPEFDTVDDDLEFHLARFGPMVRARQAAERDGSWPALRARLVELTGRLRPAEYLVVLGRKSGAAG